MSESYLFKEVEGKDESEDETTVRRIISRMSFVRNDLDSMKKLKIKNSEVKERINKLSQDTEFLINIILKNEKYRIAQ